MNNLQKNLYPPPSYINTSQQPLVNPYPIQMPSNNITPNINIHHPPVSGQNNQYFYQQPNYDNYYNEPTNFESTRYYQPKQYQPPEIPLNIVQKISLIIKSQLSSLQSIMVTLQSRKREQQSYKRKSRSRSRDKKERRRKHSRSKSSPTIQWLCSKCSFSNYEWRQKCKKCNESRPNRTFMPGPEDWRCLKCSNINYARRNQCNRCKALRQDK